MALVLDDRVKETSTTTGTGTLDLSGAVSGFQTFVAGVGNGNTTYYAIVNRDEDEWETGLGTVTDASTDTLARTTVIASSNSDSAVNFSSGTKDVFVTLPASKVANLDSNNNLTIGAGAAGVDYTLTFDGADSDGVLTWMEDEDYFKFSDDILINSTEKIQFYDTGLYIYSSTDGQLDIVADTEVQIAATTIDINGAVALNGAITGATDITLSGELDAATLDISGNADIDGTLDIAGTTTLGGTVTVNAGAIFNEAGDDVDFRIESDTQTHAFFMDASGSHIGINNASPSVALDVTGDANISGDFDVDGTANLDAVDIDGAVQLDATLTVGEDDQGYDVKFFGDTASAYMLWDTSADDLILAGGAGFVIPDAGNIGSASDTDAIAISSAGVVALSATTAASATTTAALTVAGGLGVAGDIWVGDDLTLDSDSAVLSFGDDQDITMTHVADTGVTIGGSHANGTNVQITNSAGDGDSVVQFALGGTVQYSMGVEDGDSDKFVINYGTGALGAQPALEISSAGAVTVPGNLTVSGTLSGAASAGFSVAMAIAL